MESSSYNRKKVRLINTTSLLLGFLDAFFTYLLSSYLVPVIGEERIGLFYLLAFSLIFILLLFFHRFIGKIGRVRTLYFFLGLAILASVLLSRMDQSWLAVTTVLFFLVATILLWVALDVLLEGYSEDAFSGRIRGFNLTVMNLGLLGAPFLSIWVLGHYGFGSIFFILTLGYSLVFLFTLLAFRTESTKEPKKIALLGGIKKMWREKDLFRIYNISLSMEFFYAMMIIYMPLYLLSLGVSWHNIGLLFTVMLIPFVLVQYPLGIFADKRYGEKELLIGSLMISLIASLALLGISGESLFLIGFWLFMTRVGIAGIEILRDSYFYKQIDGDDTDMIAFFRTTRPLANILGAITALLLFLVFPLKSFLFAVAVGFVFGIVNALFLRDTESFKGDGS